MHFGGSELDISGGGECLFIYINNNICRLELNKKTMITKYDF